MTFRLPTTADAVRAELDGRDYAALSHLMEFDHPIQVHADGRVTDGPAGVYAPDLYDDELDTPGPVGNGWGAWELLDGYSYFDVDPGASGAGKFLRIVSMRPSRDNSTAVYVPDSVHAFLVKSTGELVKPAGWAGPAKSTSKDPAKRGRLLSYYSLADEGSRATLLSRLAADVYAPHGGYLYSR